MKCDCALPGALADAVTELNERLKTADRVSIFLDFDGTLVPIEADPAAPRLDARTAETLRRLVSRDNFITTILSGRAVEDLYGRIQIDGLIYAGNYGLEIFGRSLRFVQPDAMARSTDLEALCAQLKSNLARFQGAQVEFKGLTASVHHRRAAEADRHEIEHVVRETVNCNGRLFRVNRGRKVLELMPRSGWHKGSAVRWINEQLGAGLSVCLGDDSSDEEAFAVLPGAITIKVGPVTTTRARFRLKDPGAVHHFLECLAG